MLYTPVIQSPGSVKAIDPALQEACRTAERVIIRVSNWLGDALMTLPATFQIRSLLRVDAELAVLTPKGLAAIWEASPWIDRVFSMPEKRIDAETRQAIRHFQPSLGIVFPNSFGSAWDLWRCGIPVLYGRGGNFRSWMLKRRIPVWKHTGGYSDRHQLSYYMELASAMGPIDWDWHCPSLEILPSLSHGIKKGDGWLAIAPGAAFGPAKQWPPEYFAHVAQEWLDHRGGRIVIVGTQKEVQAASQIAAVLPDDRVLNMAGKTSMKELMAILGSVDFAIANDSGAMHLSAALGTNGIAVFGSTDPVATGPVGATWQIFKTNALCAPCFQRTCTLPPQEAYKCLKTISPEIVAHAMLTPMV